MMVEPELHVGEEFDSFAVSFWSDVPLVRSTESTRIATPIADGRYRVNAEVIYICSKTRNYQHPLSISVSERSAMGQIFFLMDAWRAIT